jgi:two-component system, cell cycle sensor histidine kinase and response regulator CckA
MKTPDNSPVAPGGIGAPGADSAPDASPGDVSGEYLISIETVRDLVCIVEDGRVMHVNSGGISTLGARSLAEIAGLLFEDLLAPDYREFLVDGFDLWLAESAPVPLKMVRLDGELIELELMIRPYSNGGKDSVIVFGRDITKKNEAAVALLERERRISAIMENVPDGIIVIDQEGRIESLNRAAEEMFGYSAAESIGCNVKMLMGDADRERHDSYLRNFAKRATGTDEIMEFRDRDFVGRRKNGSTFPMGLAVREMKSGVKRQFIGTISDITERKRREEALQQRETQLREIVDNAPLQIALSDSNGRYALVNRSFAEAHGTEPDSLLGKSVNDLFPPEVADVMAGGRRKVLETGEMNEFERSVSGSDGEHFEHVIRFPIPGPDDAPAGVGIIISDITEQKRLQEQIRESGKLSSLGQLAGGIAHDFNNLLMVTGGYAKRALVDPTDPERVESALLEIVAATDKAADLTKQLLAFSRRQVLESRVVRVKPLVSELQSMLSPLLGEVVTLTVDVTDDQICVEADPSQLSQLLINLAINARDAMPAGGGIRIGAEVAEASEALRKKHPETGSVSYVKFSIQDHGVGMDAKTLARIFEPFFTTKEQGKGTGLGMAMVYGFVQQSHGLIDVISTPGEGTTVEVYLPLADKPPEAVTAIDRELFACKGETVLLAEDDDALRQLAVMTLEEIGYTVLVASDGFQALEIEDEHEGAIDLLLTDIIMPGLGGLDLSKAIRETRPDIKVILMSGYPSRGEGKAFDLPEGLPLLQKPFDPEYLAHNVRNILDGDDLFGRAS